MQVSWELEVAEDRLGNAVKREGLARNRLNSPRVVPRIRHGLPQRRGALHAIS